MSGTSVKYLLVSAFLLMTVFPLAAFSAEPDSLTAVFWNLENFFDPRDAGGGPSDTEFSSRGSRHWTWEKFGRKRDLVGKTLLWIGGQYGKLPEIVGFAEVENAYVLWSLCQSMPLKKAGYGYVHFDSPDHRGIDVGLLYRKSAVEVLEAGQLPLCIGRDTLRTRSILQVRVRHRSGKQYLFLVNHHPSKFSGAKASQRARESAMQRLVYVCKDADIPVIAMGDFNDVPVAPQFKAVEGVLSNLGASFLLNNPGKEPGTIRFDGKWQLIDFFLVSPVLEKRCRMQICTPPYLLEWEGKHAGYKPFRTFSGPRYKGGVSDHLPVILRLGH